MTTHNYSNFDTGSIKTLKSLSNISNVLKFELFASKEPSIFAEILGGKNANEPHMVIGNFFVKCCRVFSKTKYWSWFYHVKHIILIEIRNFFNKIFFLSTSNIIRKYYFLAL